jgi:hypothetical protein
MLSRVVPIITRISYTLNLFCDEERGRMELNYGRNKSTLQGKAGIALDCKSWADTSRWRNCPEFLLQKTTQMGTGTSQPVWRGGRNRHRISIKESVWRQQVRQNT